MHASLALIDPGIRARRENLRLIGFLALSVLLHLAWLAWPLDPHRPSALRNTPLVAHLPALLQSATPVVSPSKQPEKPATDTITRPHVPGAPASATLPPLRAPGLPEAVPPPVVPTIDLDAARASARAYAREPRPARKALSGATPPRPATVESAIARVMEPDRVVESRGPAGELVTETRDMRCVTPLVVPHYLQGMTVPTQCTPR